MKCPKCGYTSFPYLESCRKCGQDLMEIREWFGVYALPPNPPDLTLAYETPQTDAIGTPAVAVEDLEESAIYLIDVDDAAMTPSAEPPSAEATFEIDPTFDLDAEPLSPLSPTRSEPDRRGDKEPIVIDLNDLEGLTLELREVAGEEEGTPLGIPRPRVPAEADETIFEVERGDEEGLLAREPVSEGAGFDDDNPLPPEYVLEIDEELEIEIEENDEDDEDADDTNH